MAAGYGMGLEEFCVQTLKMEASKWKPGGAGGEALGGGNSIPAMLKAVGAPEAVKQTLVAHCIHSTPVGEICTKCEEHWRQSREYMSEVCAKCHKIRAEHTWHNGKYQCVGNVNEAFEPDPAKVVDFFEVAPDLAAHLAAGHHKRHHGRRDHGNIGVDAARAGNAETIDGVGCSSAGGSSGGDSAGGVEPGDQSGGESSTSKLDGGTVAKADSAYSQGDSGTSQTPIKEIVLKARSVGISVATGKNWPVGESRSAFYVETPKGPGAHDDRTLAAAVAAHSHVLSSADPTPRVVDTAPVLCQHCKKPLERRSPVSLHCKHCGRSFPG